MNFKYFDFKKDIFKELINEQTAVFIFNNYSDLKQAAGNYRPSPLEKQSIFLTLDEFKRRIFSSDKILMGEDKLSLVLYSVLNREEKKELMIDNYQDIYYFSEKFFSFFDLLNEYNISQLVGLNNWQQERYELLCHIKDKFQKKIEELNLFDILKSKNVEELNLNWVEEGFQLIFFNILDFSPYLKNILKTLDQKEVNITLTLQIDRDDFDEKNLNLEKLSFPKQLPTELKIFQSSTEIKSLASILLELEETKQIYENKNEMEDIKDKDSEKKSSAKKIPQIELIDPSPDKIDYENILSKEFKESAKISFTDNNFYKLLELLLNLYQKSKFEDRLLLHLPTIQKLSSHQLFRKWSNFSAAEHEVLQNFIKEDYYYIDIEKIKKDIEALELLYDFIIELRNIKSIEELISLVNNILSSLEIELDNEVEENFFESLLELRSLNNLGIKSDFNQLFTDFGGGIFKILLNILSKRRTKRYADDLNYSIYQLNNAPMLKRDKVLIVNCTQDKFTFKKDGLFFLNEKQLKQNGLPDAEKSYLIKKYHFLRHIFNSEESIIFTVNNLDENIYPAAVLEELLLYYGLEFEKSRAEEIKEKDILVNFMNFEEQESAGIINSFGRLNKVDNQIFNSDLKLVEDEFNNNYSLSYYKYRNLKDCFHRFYLENIIGLDTTAEISQSLSLKNLGILTHQVFADLILYAVEEGLSFNEIDSKKIREITFRVLEENILKTNYDYLSFYKNIIIPKLESSFLRFAELIKSDTPETAENILVEWPEWNYEKKSFYKKENTSFFLSGRIDLLFMDQNEYFIIDFKTGGGNKKQLDFYSLMLKENYSAELPDASRKAIYSVFDEKLNRYYQNKEDAIKKEMQELINELFEAKKYRRIYKSRCKRCPYLEICRVEDLDNE